MADAPNQLGEAIINVRVDDTGIGPGIATAVQSAQGASTSVTGIAAEVERSSMGVRATLQSLVSMVSVTGLVLAAAAKVADVFNGWAKGTAGAEMSIQELTIGVNSLAARQQVLVDHAKKLNDAYNEVTQNTNAIKAGWAYIANIWNGMGTPSQIFEKIKLTNDDIDSNNKSMRAAQTEREIAAALQVAKAQEVASLQGEDKIRAVRDKDIDELDAKRKQLYSQEANDIYQRAIEFRKKAAELEMSEYRERVKREQELQDKSLAALMSRIDAQSRAYQAALDDIGDRSAKASGFDGVITTLEMLGQKLDGIARNTRGRM